MLKKHGEPERFWPQWCTSQKTPQLRELVALGAILTQRTSWHNADLALRNLQKAGILSLSAIAALPNLEKLTELIRPAGFYTTKPQRLFDLCSFVARKYGCLEKLRKEKLAVAREKLLTLKGIGPETADTILLYALDKPTFVIDEYTNRLLRSRGLATEFEYDHLKKLFEEQLPREVVIYQNFHALIIIEQKGEAGSVMTRVSI